jgi:multidrug efflux pump subunit AcrA (membrane-fusion protein)
MSSNSKVPASSEGEWETILSHNQKRKIKEDKKKSELNEKKKLEDARRAQVKEAQAKERAAQQALQQAQKESAEKERLAKIPQAITYSSILRSANSKPKSSSSSSSHETVDDEDENEEAVYDEKMFVEFFKDGQIGLTGERIPDHLSPNPLVANPTPIAPSKPFVPRNTVNQSQLPKCYVCQKRHDLGDCAM